MVSLFWIIIKTFAGILGRMELGLDSPYKPVPVNELFRELRPAVRYGNGAVGGQVVVATVTVGLDSDDFHTQSFLSIAINQ